MDDAVQTVMSQCEMWTDNVMTAYLPYEKGVDHGQFSHVESVSYTHLDVYKRQNPVSTHRRKIS